MKKLRLLKALRVLIASLAIGTSIFSVVSCSDISDTAEEQIDTQGKVLLRVSVNDLARTVIPSNPASVENFVNFKLYGVKTDSYKNTWSAYPEEDKILMKTFNTYEALTNGTFELEGAYARNCWRFYLTATNSANGAEFGGMSPDCLTLYLTGVNTIDFTLRLTELGTGNGNFEYNFNYESSSNASDVTSATASLYALNENGTYATNATKSWTLNSTDLAGSKFQISSETQGIEANTYRLVINLYCENVLIGQWFEVVQIATGLTSKGVAIISNLTTVYQVYYYLKHGTNDTVSFDGVTTTEQTITKLTAEGTANLLVPEYEGHVFLGWFTDENYENPLNLDSSTGLRGNVQVWAKWISGSLTSLSAENAADAIRGLSPSSATLENPAVIKVTGTATDGFMSNISNAMKINPNAYVSLDLSGVSGITNLPSGAFSNCPSIVSIVLPEDITKISDYAFSNTSISTITIPASVTEIGTNVFEYCENLAEITVAQGNTTFKIVDGCLCSETRVICCPQQNAATSVTLPSTITTIDRYAFQNAKNLTSVVLNEGLLSIGARAFERTSLESVIIPNSVTEIGESAFREIATPMTVTIGSGVSSIGSQILCTSLCSAINVSADNSTYKSIDGVLYSKNEKELLIYPYGKECKNFVIPDSVETIKAGAFELPAYLENVTLGANVKLIEYYAFCSFSRVTQVDDYLWYFYGSSQYDLTYNDVVSYGEIKMESLSTTLNDYGGTSYYYAKSTDKTFENTAGFSPTTISAFTDSATKVTEETFQVTEFTATLQEKWYKVTTTAGKKYTVYWADQETNPSGFTGGTGLNDIDGKFYIYDYGKELKSVDHDPTTFTVSASGTALYVYVKPYKENDTGKCAFRIEEIKDTE